jgi:hypothetical protein
MFRSCAVLACVSLFICSASNSLVASSSKNNKDDNNAAKVISQNSQSDDIEEDSGDNDDESAQLTSNVANTADPTRMKMLQTMIAGVLLRSAETAMAMLSLNADNTVPQEEMPEDDL